MTTSLKHGVFQFFIYPQKRDNFFVFLQGSVTIKKFNQKKTFFESCLKLESKLFFRIDKLCIAHSGQPTLKNNLTVKNCSWEQNVL